MEWCLCCSEKPNGRTDEIISGILFPSFQFKIHNSISCHGSVPLVISSCCCSCCRAGRRPEGEAACRRGNKQCHHQQQQKQQQRQQEEGQNGMLSSAAAVDNHQNRSQCQAGCKGSVLVPTDLAAAGCPGPSLPCTSLCPTQYSSHPILSPASSFLRPT